MAPSKKAPAAAKENVSLGPLAGDGMFNNFERAGTGTNDEQASSFSALPASSPPSTIPSFTLPISREYLNQNLSQSTQPSKLELSATEQHATKNNGLTILGLQRS